MSSSPVISFFFQAEDGIRDRNVTGVQTCALPISDHLDAGAPELGGDRFELRRARHPLLVLQRRGLPGAIVANDVALPAPAQALIVSGPNAGGKTVTITSVGLFALMARAGLPLPADAGSRMPLYRTVYTAIGDEGDLSRDLSTFTAHITSLKHILEAAGPGTLVLIDEIAADTDPREGAAIAVAALEKLVDAGAQVLITTHLEELKALARAGLGEARTALERERSELQRERERLRELEQATRAGAREELIEDLRRRREEVARLVAQLQAAPAMAQAVEAQRAIERAAAEQEREQGRHEEPEALPEAEIAPGTRVKHVGLG